jgi:hypothetical protein
MIVPFFLVDGSLDFGASHPVPVATPPPTATPALDEIGNLRALLFGQRFMRFSNRLDHASAGLAEERVVLQENVGHCGLVDDPSSKDAREVAARLPELVFGAAERTSKFVGGLHDDLLLTGSRIESLEERAQKEARTDASPSAVTLTPAPAPLEAAERTSETTSATPPTGVAVARTSRDLEETDETRRSE